jgi:catechol 2,3-dioxygenase-like lactoylglutathione lyase family enzyme
VTVEAIDHVQLAMPAGGEARAREFYQGLLGIPEVPKPPELAARGGCWFERGTLRVHLGVEADFRPARKAHPGFRVRELATLVAQLEAGGCQCVRGGQADRHVYVDDPFGNRIELIAADSPPGA